MSKDIKPKVVINSPEFNAGGASKEAVPDLLFREPSIPLFLRDSTEGSKENAQDEKDETAE